jgi:hypothetical protein
VRNLRTLCGLLFFVLWLWCSCWGEADGFGVLF